MLNGTLRNLKAQQGGNQELYHTQQTLIVRRKSQLLEPMFQNIPQNEQGSFHHHHTACWNGLDRSSNPRQPHAGVAGMQSHISYSNVDGHFGIIGRSLTLRKQRTCLARYQTKWRMQARDDAVRSNHTCKGQEWSRGSTLSFTGGVTERMGNGKEVMRCCTATDADRSAGLFQSFISEVGG